MGSFLSKRKQHKDYEKLKYEITHLKQRQFSLYNNIDCIDKDLNEAKEVIRDLVCFVKSNYSEGSIFASSL